jgi:hypothetical protein
MSQNRLISREPMNVVSVSSLHRESLDPTSLHWAFCTRRYSRQAKKIEASLKPRPNPLERLVRLMTVTMCCMTTVCGMIAVKLQGEYAFDF